MEFRNDNLFTFFALKRSGHHAVMVWLAYHFNLPIFVLNNIKPYTDPFLTSGFNNNWGKGSDWLVYVEDVEQIRNVHKHCLMLSVQDFNITSLADGRDFIWERQRTVGESLRFFNILILRDPFNMLVSRWHKPGLIPKLIDDSEILDMWEIYAEEYLGITNYIKSKIAINYNLWFSSIDYRKKLSAQFGLDFTDTGLNVVPKTAGGTGSSFDRTSYDGRGNQMKVLERWKVCQQDQRFCEAFRERNRLANLYRKIFPHDSEIEAFMQAIGI
ncbi:MAG: hypothetical protein HXY43_00670 [Fischerella sp.]|uniref:hypothetical protein n=1 Tax=Fischerella sp. TaxID=1191 RepID=UPI0017E9CF81|nr:hypothetical protein [Fischerella sp.]NWF57862.1 hypothetical protein [Fischerella sp.]